jgi:hypothetical protein
MILVNHKRIYIAIKMPVSRVGRAGCTKGWEAGRGDE